RVPLSEVVRNLREEVKRRDPEKRGINFLINPQTPATAVTIDPTTGQPISPPASSSTEPDINTVAVTIPSLTNTRLADVLDAIISVAQPPVKYSILDYA